MKRPQGFDPSNRPAQRTAPSPRTTARTVPGKGSGPSAENVSATIPVESHRRNGHSRPERSQGSEPEATTAPIPLVPSSVPGAGASSGRSLRAKLREARRERKRYEREEIRRFTRRTRHRRMLWLSALGTVALLVLTAVLVSLSPLMALRTIQVSGTDRVDPAAVKKALDGQLGRPMPLLDTKAITKDLSAFPLIRSYTTEVHPPSTLVVRIVEREPVGVVKTGSKYELVDPAGVVISRFEQRPAGHPLITPKPGSAGFAAAASVLQSLPQEIATTINTVTASTEDDVTFTLLSSGATVVWGSAEKSGLKATILTDLLKSAPHANVYDVSAPHNVVTR